MRGGGGCILEFRRDAGTGDAEIKVPALEKGERERERERERESN